MKTCIAIASFGILILACGSTSNLATPEKPAISTLAVETGHGALTQTAPAIPSSTSTPLVTSSPAPTETPRLETIVDVPSILGKSVSDVEHVLGPTTLTTGPIDKTEGKLAGGEYRDYLVGRYTVTMAYDKSGVSRVFFILYGMSDENYTLHDWNVILPIFGVHIDVVPDLEAPRRVSWNNYSGLFIAVAGQPVSTVQIAQAGYHP